MEVLQSALPLPLFLKKYINLAQVEEKSCFTDALEFRAIFLLAFFCKAN